MAQLVQSSNLLSLKEEYYYRFLKGLLIFWPYPKHLREFLSNRLLFVLALHHNTKKDHQINRVQILPSKYDEQHHQFDLFEPFQHQEDSQFDSHKYMTPYPYRIHHSVLILRHDMSFWRNHDQSFLLLIPSQKPQSHRSSNLLSKYLFAGMHQPLQEFHSAH